MPDARPVVITGGAGGIGMALARRYARDGCAIALLDRDGTRLESAREQLAGEGITVSAFPCDVTDEAACHEAVAAAAKEFGGMGTLIYCAGLTQVSLCTETNAEVYQRVMDVNFFGAVYCTQAALPHLTAAHGQIIVLSSIAGFAPLIGRTGYCASKHALHGFFDTLRGELVEQGVGVLLACPSFTQTDFASRGLDGSGATLALERATTRDVLTPDQVAEGIHRAVRKGRRVATISRTGMLAWWMSRLCPAFYDRAMRKRFAGKLWQKRG
jgi:short-subunit dehydrogenase